MINENIFSELYAISEKEIAKTAKKEKKRDLFNTILNQIGKTKAMHAIAGLRGVGKTVIMLQLAKELGKAVYVSSEQLLIRSVSIYEFIKYAKLKEFLNIFIDEVHLYPNWSIEMKAAKDELELDIFFSGSCSLEIQEGGADLSRRAIIHYLAPLSFREYLLLKHAIELPKTTLEEIIDFEKRKKLIGIIAPYANYLSDYMENGALPFALEEREPLHLYEGVLSKIVRSDLAHLKKIDINYIDSIYKMLGFIATSPPDKINYNSLSNALSKNIYVIMEIIRLLKEVGLLTTILAEGQGAKVARTEYKLLFPPPFRAILCKLRSTDAIKGALREEFFINHVGSINARYIKTDRKRRTPDYVVEGTIFEVGGEDKETKDGNYAVVDGLPIDRKRIPLVLFGLLY